MLSKLISLILPDYCCSCGEIGAILCESCIHDIVSEAPLTCIACGRPQKDFGLCGSCILPYSRSWHVGEYRDSLRALVGVSKFESNRKGCDAQATLFDAHLPHLNERTIIVPVPTIARHVRQRGYGHAERVAKTLARMRGVAAHSVVQRAEQHVQHGANRAERKRQAARSYRLARSIEPDTTYLVIDDVFTTGFTASYVAQLLRDNGAHDVWVAVTAKQPLD